MTIQLDNDSAKAIIEKAFPKINVLEPFCGLLVKHGIETVGAIIFNRYDFRDVHFSCVMSKPIGMSDARCVARYVFKQLGCRRCTAITQEDNIAAQRALRKLGFKYEGRMRDHFDDSDGLVYGLLRSEQKIARM